MSLLDWDDLTHRLLRTRQGEPRENDWGEVVDDAPLTQALWGLVQPRRGRTPSEPEGLAPRADHVLYCRPTAAPGRDAAATDVAEGDTLTVTAGAAPRAFRVEFVADEGGQGDHLKVYLKFVGPGGDAA